VGLIVVSIAFLAGIFIGSLSGYIGGKFDNVVMRFTDIVISLPSLVVAMVIVLVLGKSIENIMLAIAVTAWPSYARLMRGEVLRIKEEEYVTSARALGRRWFGVVGRHVLPNALGPIVIVASLDIGSVVLTAAALSFLGIGVEVGYADWGQMISFGRDWIIGPPGQPFYYWYVSFWPGLIILLFVLGWNLLGDAFRDVLDPRAAR
jgi:peptide/nickel transport system permease protein